MITGALYWFGRPILSFHYRIRNRIFFLKKIKSAWFFKKLFNFLVWQFILSHFLNPFIIYCFKYSEKKKKSGIIPKLNNWKT